MNRHHAAFALSLCFASFGCAAEVGTELIESSEQGVSKSSLEKAVDAYGLDWIDDQTNVIRADIYIPVPARDVWTLVSDPNGYGDWNDAITAEVDEVKPGETIALDAQIILGLPPTHSVEKVLAVDHKLRAIAWHRDFGFGQVTERWQFVVPEGKGCRYITALHAPKVLGFFMNLTVTQGVRASFERFAKSLKTESIRRFP